MVTATLRKSKMGKNDLGGGGYSQNRIQMKILNYTFIIFNKKSERRKEGIRRYPRRR